MNVAQQQCYEAERVLRRSMKGRMALTWLRQLEDCARVACWSFEDWQAIRVLVDCYEIEGPWIDDHVFSDRGRQEQLL